MQRRVGVVAGFIPLCFLLVGCTNAGAAGNQGGLAGPRDVNSTGEPASEERVTQLTINVELTDAGITPSSVYIPAGKGVQLVVRNRGLREHHYRVLGLVPRDLMWVAPDEDVSGGPIDHEAHHHGTSAGAYRAASPAGIRPTGSEVHAYAHGGGGGMDVVLFTATSQGTFAVECPLNPEMVGQLTVY